MNKTGGTDTNPQPQMSRGKQTAWICATIIAVALVAFLVWNSRPAPNDPFWSCRSVLGTYDKECKAEVQSLLDQGFRYDPRDQYMEY